MTAAHAIETPRWTREGVRTRLAAARAQDAGDHDLNPDMPPPPKLKPAAVLIGLIPRDDAVQILLTRRADHLAHHPGQIAFPGGRIDAEDDSPATAALREAEEEVGLPRDHVELLGALGPYVTRTGYRVSPFVGWVRPPRRYALDPQETAEVFEAPLDALIDPAARVIESYAIGAQARRFYTIPWSGRRIWGATAGMLARLHAALGDRPI